MASTQRAGKDGTAVGRRSPLYSEHVALGARMTTFAGWEMPLYYSGVIDEHLRCRRDAVVFDVSHLGALRVAGASAFEGLQGLFTNDLARIEPGRAQYTHLLDPDDAHVVDDIIVWWLDTEEFLVIPNAANTDRCYQAIRDAVPAAVIEDVTSARAFLAVQGPRARDRLRAVLPEAAEVRRFRLHRTCWEGDEVLVGGTGYTGEDGVEICLAADGAPSLWGALLEAGVAPAGLGARDTLRLEMGYPLHGHELGPGITPLQAGLEWVVAWDKGPFRGREALEAERARGVARRLRGVRVEGRQIPRSGCPVFVEGQPVGEVTSGNFSPLLECGIGLALVSTAVETGTRAEVEIRGRRVGAVLVEPPFREA